MKRFFEDYTENIDAAGRKHNLFFPNGIKPMVIRSYLLGKDIIGEKQLSEADGAS